jgi:hypothetical protein
MGGWETLPRLAYPHLDALSSNSYPGVHGRTPPGRRSDAPTVLSRISLDDPALTGWANFWRAYGATGSTPRLRRSSSGFEGGPRALISASVENSTTCRDKTAQRNASRWGVTQPFRAGLVCDAPTALKIREPHPHKPRTLRLRSGQVGHRIVLHLVYVVSFADFIADFSFSDSGLAVDTTTRSRPASFAA